MKKQLRVGLIMEVLRVTSYNLVVWHCCALSTVWRSRSPSSVWFEIFDFWKYLIFKRPLWSLRRPSSLEDGDVARSHTAQKHVIGGMKQLALVIEILRVEDVHVPDHGGEGQKEGVQAVKEPTMSREDRGGILNKQWGHVSIFNAIKFIWLKPISILSIANSEKLGY